MSNHLLNFSTASPASVSVDTRQHPDAADPMVGHSAAIEDVLKRVRRVAPTDMPVLITGETGTGKELLARSLHRYSRRASRPLVAVNMGAIPETLAAAELFGHEKGAFTGADRVRVGRFEAADRGTLFLDEVAEATPDVQVMLLRVLQEGEFERVGGGFIHRVDVRLIAATNRRLEEEVHQRRFRDDLFYRLNVFPIHLPSLRERADDIPELASCFLDRAASRLGRRFDGIAPTSMERLQEYSWPGNIRQLQNVIEYSAVLCDERWLTVDDEALAGPDLAWPPVATVPPGSHDRQTIDSAFSEMPTLEEMKKRYVTHLLTETQGNMLRAAAILDVDRRSLYRMVSRYQLDVTRDSCAMRATAETSVDRP